MSFDITSLAGSIVTLAGASLIALLAFKELIPGTRWSKPGTMELIDWAAMPLSILFMAGIVLTII